MDRPKIKNAPPNAGAQAGATLPTFQNVSVHDPSVIKAGDTFYVFGSHLANVLRRLKRVCAFYGVRPQFILCSATIGNPKEHAEALLERAAGFGLDLLDLYRQIAPEQVLYASDYPHEPTDAQIKSELDEFIDAGDTIVVLGKYSGKYKKTGKSFQANFAHVWKMREGKAAQFIQYVDTLLVHRALQA